MGQDAFTTISLNAAAQMTTTVPYAPVVPVPIPVADPVPHTIQPANHPPIDLVPAILDPFARDPEERSARDVGLSRDMIDRLTSAEMLAMGEIAQLTRYIKNFRYPMVPPLPRWFTSTASNIWQHLRRPIGRFAETRTIKDTDGLMVPTAIGPLPFAVERALRRSGMRALDGAAPVLEIGAGQRLVAAGLKALHGSDLELHEASPKYAAMPGIVDFEHPARHIDDALLPPSYFELIYSIYGSYYSRHQLHVLHKAVNSLRVGGEIFLMWKTTRQNKKLAQLARQEAAFFQREGLDLSIEHKNFGSLTDPENVITVWARKRTPNVNVRQLFESANILHNAQGSGEVLPTARLSAEGPYLPQRFLAPRQLNFLVGMMIDTACGTLGVTVTDLARTIFGSQAIVENDAAARDRVVGRIMHDYVHKPQANGRPPPLQYQVPLTTVIMSLLYPVIPLMEQGVTMPQMENMDVQLAMARLRG